MRSTNYKQKLQQIFVIYYLLRLLLPETLKFSFSSTRKALTTIYRDTCVKEQPEMGYAIIKLYS